MTPLHIAHRTALTAALLACPTLAWACCPDDGQGAPKAASGLGEALPPAPDLAADPAWAVYEFERGGIRYLQINDATGQVRAAAGRIGDALWVLPIGSSPDRLALPGDALPAGSPRLLYRSAEIEVLLIDTATGPHWLLRPANP
jgi:hypothetical protein